MLPLKSMLLIALGAIALSGCSVGNDDSACKGKPSGHLCKSAREIYAMTNTKADLFDGTQDGVDDDEKKQSAPTSTPNSNGAALVGKTSLGRATTPQPVLPNAAPVTANGHVYPIANAFGELPAPEPLAVRQAPRLMRILFAPYEDETGALNLAGYSIVEVESRHWTVGAGAKRRNNRIVPLAIREAANQEQTEQEKKMNKVDPLGVQHTQSQAGAK